jgi:hypothetical protein
MEQVSQRSKPLTVSQVREMRNDLWTGIRIALAGGKTQQAWAMALRLGCQHCKTAALHFIEEYREANKEIRQCGRGDPGRTTTGAVYEQGGDR